MSGNVVVRNRLGKILLTKKVVDNSILKFDKIQLPNGLYFVGFTSLDGKSSSTTIIISK